MANSNGLTAMILGPCTDECEIWHCGRARFYRYHCTPKKPNILTTWFGPL